MDVSGLKNHGIDHGGHPVGAQGANSRAHRGRKQGDDSVGASRVA